MPLTGCSAGALIYRKTGTAPSWRADTSIYPGDIVTMENVKLVWWNGQDRIISSHVAVITKVEWPKVFVLHQNVGDVQKVDVHGLSGEYDLSTVSR